MHAVTTQWHTKKSKHTEWTQWDEAKSGRLNLRAAPVIVQLYEATQYYYYRAVLAIFPLTPDQIRAQIWPNGVRGGLLSEINDVMYAVTTLYGCKRRTVECRCCCVNAGFSCDSYQKQRSGDIVHTHHRPVLSEPSQRLLSEFALRHGIVRITFSTVSVLTFYYTVLCLSVQCPSVHNIDHRGWVIWKLIMWIIRLGSSLLEAPELAS